MKKVFLKALVIVPLLAIICLVILTGCDSDCSHIYGDWTTIVNPSCSEIGAKKRECNKCGQEDAAFMDALGHTIEIDSSKAATCTSAGLTEGKHCSVCDEVLVAQETVPANGHTPGEEATCTTAQICTVCDAELVAAKGHNEVTDEAVAPTCTTAGLTEGKHCSLCGEVFVAQNKIDALGHTEVPFPYIAPSCTAPGLTQGTGCSVCKETLVAQAVIPELDHTEVVDPYIAPSCTNSGLSEGKHCSVCNAVIVAQKKIDAKGHSTVVDAYVAPTCTKTGLTQGKHCSVCNVTIVAQVSIAAKGHTEVVDPYVAPTCAAVGFTQGSHCSVCRVVLVAQVKIPALDTHNYGLWRLSVYPTDTSNGTEARKCAYCEKKETRSVTWDTVDWEFLSIYNSRYGYEYLGTLDNGENLQALYNEIDKYVREFHFNTNLTTSDNEVATINLKKYNTIRHNIVLKVYRYDNPLYYWLSSDYGGVGYEFTILTYSEYASGSVREQYNALIFDAIDKYTNLVTAEVSAYKIALAYHDAIIDAVDYAPDEDKYAQWAHNILGVFEKSSGVCESYAKAFQLLLNASGVNNIYIVGQSGSVGHAWNLVQMDDGNWYWCDLTWDDSTNSYRYFCAGDTSNFLSNHTCGTTSFYSKHYLYQLPDRPTTSYTP